MENTLIPPRSQMILPGRIDKNRMSQDEAEHVWTTEANELKNGVKMARAIMPHRLNEVPVFVLNDSNVSKKIDAGTVLSKLNMAECINDRGALEGGVSDAGCYEYLGKLTKGIDNSVVSGDGVSTDPENITAVRDCPVPTDIKEVRSFFRLASYYRKFVPAFAGIAAPLHALATK